MSIFKMLGVAMAAMWMSSALPAQAGTIRGVVSFNGSVEAKKLPVTIDQYNCGKEKSSEKIVVGPKRGVKNAVVWLRTPPPGAAWPSAPVKVEMDQKECVFVPRVVLVPAGGTVDFLNSDRLLHNLHSASKENPPFNRTQPRARTIPIVFAKPEIIRVTCDLHSWMEAWVVVADHPFYALTGDTGDLPPQSFAGHLTAGHDAPPRGWPWADARGTGRPWRARRRRPRLTVGASRAASRHGGRRRQSSGCCAGSRSTASRASSG